MDRKLLNMLNILSLLKNKPMTYDELWKTGCFKTKTALGKALYTLDMVGLCGENQSGKDVGNTRTRTFFSITLSKLGTITSESIKYTLASLFSFEIRSIELL